MLLRPGGKRHCGGHHYLQGRPSGRSNAHHHLHLHRLPSLLHITFPLAFTLTKILHTLLAPAAKDVGKQLVQDEAGCDRDYPTCWQAPDAGSLQKLVEPVGKQLMAASEQANDRRSTAFNQVKTASEALQALTWVIYTGPSCGALLPLNICKAVGTEESNNLRYLWLQICALHDGHRESGRCWPP